MAKIKTDTIEDSTLVRFDALQSGKVFVYEGEPYMRVYAPELTAIRLNDGTVTHFFNGSTLVTYVKRADLTLTI